MLIFLIITGCRHNPAVIVHSPEASKISYAIKDSFDAARIDLADSYSEQLYSLVTPPEDKIVIKPIFKNGKRVVVIPKKYQTDEVVIINTEEWSKLIASKEISMQILSDNETLKKQLSNIEAEKIEQEKIKLELSAQNVKLSINVEHLDKMLFKLKIYLTISISVIVGYAYIKFKKLIPL